MIVNEMVRTKWSNRTRKYYESLGYTFTGRNTELWVLAEHLPRRSNVPIRAICDGCGKMRFTTKNAYTPLCNECFHKDDEYRAKVSASMTKVMSDPTRIELQRLHGKRRMLEDDGFRERFLAGRDAYWGSEGVEIHSAFMKEWYSDPENYESFLLTRKRGPENPHFNPNKTWVQREMERQFTGYRAWRRKVFSRDDYTCTCCGKRGGSLEAHHIESYADNPDLRTVVENGATLCSDCHNKFHNTYGRGRNTRQQFEEFIASFSLEQEVTDYGLYIDEKSSSRCV